MLKFDVLALGVHLQISFDISTHGEIVTGSTDMTIAKTQNQLAFGGLQHRRNSIHFFDWNSWLQDISLSHCDNSTSVLHCPNIRNTEY
jgi:hypothetical protein